MHACLDLCVFMRVLTPCRVFECIRFGLKCSYTLLVGILFYFIFLSSRKLASGFCVVCNWCYCSVYCLLMFGEGLAPFSFKLYS